MIFKSYKNFGSFPLKSKSNEPIQCNALGNTVGNVFPFTGIPLSLQEIRFLQAEILFTFIFRKLRKLIKYLLQNKNIFYF